MSRQIDWNSVVLKADPEHQQNSLNPIEYEFTASARGPAEKPDLHDNGLRIFRGHYKTRGAYSSDE